MKKEILLMLVVSMAAAVARADFFPESSCYLKPGEDVIVVVTKPANRMMHLPICGAKRVEDLGRLMSPTYRFECTGLEEMGDRLHGRIVYRPHPRVAEDCLSIFYLTGGVSAAEE